MSIVDEILARSLHTVQYEEGHSHSWYEFTQDELTDLIAAVRAEEPLCNPHPRAPHGFVRNASHNEDQYVCECRGWDPYEAGYDAGFVAGLNYENDLLDE